MTGAVSLILSVATFAWTSGSGPAVIAAAFAATFAWPIGSIATVFLLAGVLSWPGCALANLDVEEYISNWLVTMLKSRIITASLGNSVKSKRVERGTPQGGVISPLLWLIVVNTILKELDNRGIKVVAYADDVVILVSGMFPDVISDIMSGALVLLSNWATDSGLGVNPNSKLSWKLNIQHRVKKATVAYYTCRKMFGMKWGLSPNIVKWMYTAIVRPILTYGSLVWWTSTKKKFVVDQLYKVQRSACIGITGAIRTSPSEALNTILHILPIDLHIMTISACSAVRLNSSGSWISRTYGHAKILSLLPPILNQPSDYITPHTDFDRVFKVRVPSRSEWCRGNLPSEYTTRIFTDGSKMNCGVGSGVFCEEAGVSISHRLPNNCSVFQAEIFAIMSACRVLHDLNIRGNIGIFVRSQAALLSLNSYTTTSLLVRQSKSVNAGSAVSDTLFPSLRMRTTTIYT
ncbi:uncharacterized protein LOC124420850 [Lucilia cuprina]|uniref:uncharacterized protein LOC124420850 n=1 Tax=Lucilia cuprina TaxID=7375 RepID=UPI001F05B763|nr:uncharacterized protein LOC124420850 [Lucilia cuprina]